MYLIKKIVYWLANPLSLGLTGIGVGLMAALGHYAVIGLGLIALSLAWLWLWSLPALYKLIGAWLERKWWGRGVEEWKAGEFDYIIELGGGVSCDLVACPTAEGVAASERALYAAKLWKMGFAPKVVVTGVYTSAIDKGILMQCGVSADDIIEERTARNTVENAKGVMEAIGGQEGRKVGELEERRVLLVTSAWHMARAMATFRRHAPMLRCTAAPCNFAATRSMGARRFRLGDFLPEPGALAYSSAMIKEAVWLAVVGD